MKSSMQVLRLQQLHISGPISIQTIADHLALLSNPRDPMRGFFYWGYFYFYFFTNTTPFQAAGSVMPG